MSAARSVLVVDDDTTLRRMLVQQLCVDGEFAAAGASDAAEAEARLLSRIERWDAVILDVTLPDGDGRDLCMRLRRAGLKMPIIMLTGSDEESDIVRGLEAGANDYIAKPFRLAELLARLRAQLRAFEATEDAVLPIGRLSFHPAEKLLIDPDRDKRIRLTEKETAILRCLHRAAPRPVARDALLDAVWGYNALVSTHTLETHIYRLRRKLEPEPSRLSVLLTEGGGYRLEVADLPGNGSYG